MKELLKHFNYLLIGEIFLDVLLCLFSLFLLINPQMSTILACQCLSILIIVNSLFCIFKYLFENRISFYKYDIIYSLLGLLLGLFVLAKPDLFYSLLIYSFGIWLFILGTGKLLVSLMLKKYNDDSFVFSLAISLIIILLAILVVLNPFASKIAFTAFTGVILFFYSSINILHMVLFLRHSKKIIKYFK